MGPEQEQNEEGDENMDTDAINESRRKMAQRIIELSANLPDEARQELIDLVEEAASVRGAAILGESINALQESLFAAESMNEETRELLDGLYMAVSDYLDEVVCPEVESMQEEQDIIREENSTLLDLLSATLEILGVDAERVAARAKVVAKARARAASSAGSYSDDVADFDNAERNRASVHGGGARRAVGRDGLGDSAGLQKEDVDPRVEPYLNMREGFGLLSPNRTALSLAVQPQQLSEAEEHKLTADYEKGQRYADALEAMNQRYSWTRR